MLQFAIAFSDRVGADEALDSLEAHGFAVELQTSYPGWVVSAVPHDSSTDADSAMKLKYDVAARSGGQVLGHGGITALGLGDLDTHD